MKIRYALVGLLVLIVTACNQQKAANDTPDLNSEKDKASYAIGLQIGQNLKNQGFDVDSNIIAAAINDVLNGKEPRLKHEEIQTVMQSVMQKMQVAKMEAMKAQGEKNKKTSAEFLASNGKKEGVKTLKSGIQYKVVEAGKGKSPKVSDTVAVHYRGTLVDGTEFDSSYKRGQPAVFPINGVIKGWQEILPLMKPGAKWHVAIPAELAYGERGAPGGQIGPDAALIFEIQLIEVKKSEAKKPG